MTRKLNGLLIVLVAGISFIVGGAVFNISFCKSAQGLIVAGTLKDTSLSQSLVYEPVYRLDDEPAGLEVVQTQPEWKISIQPSARAYYSQPTVSGPYMQWGAR